MFRRTLIETVWLLTAVPAIFGAVWLLGVSVTPSGRLVALSLIFIWVAILMLFFRHHFSGGIRLGGCILLGLGSFFLGTAWWRAPRPVSMPITAPGPRAEYSGSAVYRSWSPASLVPEVDQHLMGAGLFSLIDPLIDSKQGSRVGDLTRAIYGEMNRDPAFRALPSALGTCYAEIFGTTAPTGHRFVFIPASESKDARLPVILFLHGSLGNFQGYLWVWKRLADAEGFAIVAPSHGIGDWQDSEGLAEISRTLDYCLARPDFDDRRIFLAGLSNGGAGVTFAAPQLGGKIAGRIYLSPVIDPEALGAPDYGTAAGRSPVLVITGSDDNRVPTDYVARGVAALRKTCAAVEYHTIPEEDHFLLFSQPDRVMSLIGDWLKTQPPAKPGVP
jgi:pimeloyl-ACP methyl ester carboxylesterase